VGCTIHLFGFCGVVCHGPFVCSMIGVCPVVTVVVVCLFDLGLCFGTLVSIVCIYLVPSFHLLSSVLGLYYEDCFGQLLCLRPLLECWEVWQLVVLCVFIHFIAVVLKGWAASVPAGVSTGPAGCAAWAGLVSVF
jgi:hypothetical protein